ncbi:hypothetical protein L226DRAFT_513158 [Lentinus tigrinus ALCF2SS1-7]|uniref:Uncharacterized protein n=1 Tax=Lentinus tigrinus ALCF2SS1-6 TaxID=1328759 RepID=A0A5C2RZD7_9APHY|nr:hypothetical protein L227DRAFT_578864 [Lentinus tigrinus ALCF2SS1-6]RPD71457.1 hypothetical protein L226DRAFT_513158 [Lentinus tigrinus ALCF2SS1-7]
MATTTAGSSAQASSSAPHTAAHTPILATGDWTKNLVHLAKTAELKKHALTLQLHTAHILSAHAALEQKNKVIQDLKEQKNKLESERSRLLNCLREVNEDRDKADLAEATLDRDVKDLHQKIKTITDGEYAAAKQEVDRLRQELGQAPLPSLQTTLEEKSAEYLKALRLQSEAANAAAGTKRPGDDLGADGQPVKRPRGRPKGSKNSKTKAKAGAGTTPPVAGGASNPT